PLFRSVSNSPHRQTMLSQLPDLLATLLSTTQVCVSRLRGPVNNASRGGSCFLRQLSNAPPVSWVPILSTHDFPSSIRSYTASRLLALLACPLLRPRAAWMLVKVAWLTVRESFQPKKRVVIHLWMLLAICWASLRGR